MEHGPRAAVTQLDRGEVDYVEVDVVLAHELEQLDIFLIEPPAFPFRGVVGGDTRVADRRVELSSYSEVKLMIEN